MVSVEFKIVYFKVEHQLEMVLVCFDFPNAVEIEQLVFKLHMSDTWLLTCTIGKFQRRSYCNMLHLEQVCQLILEPSVEFE